MKLFCKSALLIAPPTKLGQVTFNLCNGYATANNEDEMRGKYYSYLKEHYPDHDIKDILVMEITVDQLEAALQEIKGSSNEQETTQGESERTTSEAKS